VISVKAALQLASGQFSSDSAALDAQLLLCHVIGKSRAWLYTWPDAVLTSGQLRDFNQLCNRRAEGEPVAYVTGRRQFRDMDLVVNPAVLIPRPETELLVELALASGQGKPGPVADLGTGSGAIALALADERPDWQVIATDLSAAALAVAATNLRNSGLSNVQLLQGAWCEPLPAALEFSVIASNPPYVADHDPHLLLGDLRFEPRPALVAADDGLADIRAITLGAFSRLAAGGTLLLEHGWQQGEAVRATLRARGYANIATHRDLGGRDRVTMGCRLADSTT
jgi:release factor glutamine methyltransferase